LAQSRHPVSDIPAGKTFDFLTFNFLTFDFLTNGFASGVSEFEIIGIDPGVNPTDITAFVTGLTFTMDGSFTGTMQPIVEETTPVPSLRHQPWRVRSSRLAQEAEGARGRLAA